MAEKDLKENPFRDEIFNYFLNHGFVEGKKADYDYKHALDVGKLGRFNQASTSAISAPGIAKRNSPPLKARPISKPEATYKISDILTTNHQFQKITSGKTDEASKQPRPQKQCVLSKRRASERAHHFPPS